MPQTEGMTTWLPFSYYACANPQEEGFPRKHRPCNHFSNHQPSKNNASCPHHQASFEWRSRHSPPTHPQTALQSCSPRWYFARQWSIRCYTGHPTLPTHAVVSLANGHPHDEIWIEPPGIISLPLVSWQNFVPSPELHIDQDKHNFCPTSLEATRTGLVMDGVMEWLLGWLIMANCLMLGR